jgi:hypothetical protein
MSRASDRRHELLETDIETVEHAEILEKVGKKLEPLPAGPTMDLDFRNTPLPALLQLIAHAGNLNLVLPDYGRIVRVGPRHELEQEERDLFER